MLPATQLLQTLQHHQGIYDDPTSSNRVVLLASKASILEVCGWVEQAMDSVVKDCANRIGLSAPHLKSVEDDYVAQTHGFQYKTHFEKMLVAVVGFKVLETVEAAAPTHVSALKGLLGNLNVLRRHYAHTHFDELSPYPPGLASIPTPSVMISHANTVEIGLSAIEVQLVAAGC